MIKTNGKLNALKSNLTKTISALVLLTGLFAQNASLANASFCYGYTDRIACVINGKCEWNPNNNSQCSAGPNTPQSIARVCAAYQNSQNCRIIGCVWSESTTACQPKSSNNQPFPIIDSNYQQIFNSLVIRYKHNPTNYCENVYNSLISGRLLAHEVPPVKDFYSIYCN